MKKIIKHLSHSLLLFGILMSGFVGLILFSYDRNIQLLIAFLTSVGYVIWGVIHHKHNLDFHFEVLLEYIAVAVLGMVIIFTLVIWS
jgi:hypothetical protein